MILEFGDTQAYRDFHTAYPNADDAFDKIYALANDVFGRRLEETDVFRDTCFSLGEECRDDFAEIVFLA